MLTQIIPKLPMRHKATTKAYYINKLGFVDIAQQDYESYLILAMENCELHFFEHTTLDTFNNYGQIYVRTNNIDELYTSFKAKGVAIHPAGDLIIKPWGQKEFSLLDPDNNLLTFGEAR
jgi:hypothetical protein